MTFTFATNLSTDLAKIRFHCGDTNSDGAYLADETINALYTIEGSVGAASIACIRYIITQLSSPDFYKDWLRVSNAEARKGFENLLKLKAQEFGINLGGVTATATISLPYRADSYQYTSADRVATEETDETAVYDGSP
jgi:hypothetical protein